MARSKGDDNVRSLADAANDALGSSEGDEVPEGQQVLVPACKVKFVGMTYDSMDDVPKLKETVKFEVEGWVEGHGQKVMKDGEVRELANVRVTSVKQVV